MQQNNRNASGSNYGIAFGSDLLILYLKNQLPNITLTFNFLINLYEGGIQENRSDLERLSYHSKTLACVAQITTLLYTRN